MEIEKGWRFHDADFSVQAAGQDCAYGIVTLVRDPKEKKKWHNMSDEDKDDERCPPLYVIGHGITLYDAIMSANLAASHAEPIREPSIEDKIQ